MSVGRLGGGAMGADRVMDSGEAPAASDAAPPAAAPPAPPPPRPATAGEAAIEARLLRQITPDPAADAALAELREAAGPSGSSLFDTAANVEAAARRLASQPRIGMDDVRALVREAGDGGQIEETEREALRNFYRGAKDRLEPLAKKALGRFLGEPVDPISPDELPQAREVVPGYGALEFGTTDLGVAHAGYNYASFVTLTPPAGADAPPISFGVQFGERATNSVGEPEDGPRVSFQQGKIRWGGDLRLSLRDAHAARAAYARLEAALAAAHLPAGEAEKARVVLRQIEKAIAREERLIALAPEARLVALARDAALANDRPYAEVQKLAQDLAQARESVATRRGLTESERRAIRAELDTALDLDLPGAVARAWLREGFPGVDAYLDGLWDNQRYHDGQGVGTKFFPARELPLDEVQRLREALAAADADRPRDRTADWLYQETLRRIDSDLAARAGRRPPP